VHCDVTRSRSRNRELARERLAELLRAALARSRPRRPTRVPPAARAARLDAKQRRAATKARRARPRAED
jgi:ribosome-associated protein